MRHYEVLLSFGMRFAAILVIAALLMVSGKESGGCAGASDKLTGVEAFVTGGTSRAIAAAALCPVTVVKTRMEYSVGPLRYKVGVANAHPITAEYSQTP